MLMKPSIAVSGSVLVTMHRSLLISLTWCQGNGLKQRVTYIVAAARNSSSIPRPVVKDNNAGLLQHFVHYEGSHAAMV